MSLEAQNVAGGAEDLWDGIRDVEHPALVSKALDSGPLHTLANKMDTGHDEVGTPYIENMHKNGVIL